MTCDQRRTSNALVQEQRVGLLQAAKKMKEQLESRCTQLAAEKQSLVSEVLASGKASLQAVTLELQRDAARTNHSVLAEKNSEKLGF